MRSEREKFEEWHFMDWKLNNAVTDTVEFARELYDRVYSHYHTSSIRDVEFKAWQAAKADAVPKWIETAIQPPEEGQMVIIYGIYGVGMAEFSYLYKDEFVMYDMGASNPILSKDQVKFWMPLPDAPQEPAND